MIDYTWVAWFKELVTTIARNGERDLADKAKAVDWKKDSVPLLNYGDENIDPMSFLYFLAQKNTKNQYESVLGSVHKVFGITSDFPKTRPFIPAPRSNVKALFHDDKPFYPKLLWRLFRQAAPSHKMPIIRPKDFKAVLRIRNVRMTKLTQTLFITNPIYFLPIDKTISTTLPQLGSNNDVKDYKDYVKRMHDVKRLFPECELYEINTFLDTQAKKKPLITKKPSFFPISTNVYNDGTDYWEQTDALEEDEPFKENHYVYTGRVGGKRKKKRKYQLKDSRRGDVILVRYGLGEGRAIGVVEENGYAPDGSKEDKVTSVHWINKISAPVDDLKNLKQLTAFTRAQDQIQSAFRNTDAYKVSFDLIAQWIGDRGAEPQPDPEPPAEEPDMSFPLNTILFGPPGTGKTWEAVSHAVAIVDNEDPVELAQAENRKNVKARFEKLREEGQVEFVTFHQNYTYEDFIEGIVPVLKSKELLYELRDGVFKRISSRAHEHSNERHVLIIDEINRGNIAKIFGELITLIEPTKRSGGEDKAVVTLPYSQEPFRVPGNLYLVGTMNTADRGIALLDTALRRRFDFIEMMPNVRLVAKDIEGVDGQAMLEAMNERITVYLGREHQIGHTYLIGVQTINGLAEAFQRRIVPLLQEYFYDDWAKIRSVLNENPFIREREIETSIRDAHSERPVFELLAQDDEGWMNAESYWKIYTSE